MAEAREQLGEKAFQSAWAEGQAATTEEAIALALHPDLLQHSQHDIKH